MVPELNIYEIKEDFVKQDISNFIKENKIEEWDIKVKLDSTIIAQRYFIVTWKIELKDEDVCYLRLTFPELEIKKVSNYIT